MADVKKQNKLSILRRKDPETGKAISTFVADCFVGPNSFSTEMRRGDRLVIEYADDDEVSAVVIGAKYGEKSLHIVLRGFDVDGSCAVWLKNHSCRIHREFTKSHIEEDWMGARH